MWWRGLPRITLSDTIIGLLIVIGLGIGGWILHYLITFSAELLTQPLVMSRGSLEPNRLEQLRQTARQLLERNMDWMGGALLTLLTIYSGWLILEYVVEWRKSNKTIAHPLDSWPVTFGFCGIAIFGPLLLSWIAAVLP